MKRRRRGLALALVVPTAAAVACAARPGGPASPPPIASARAAAVPSATSSGAAAASSAAASPARPSIGPHLAPGARVARGSLFQTDVVGLYDGGLLTPDAAPGSRVFELDPHVAGMPALRASNAVATALSPDGKTLLVLTSGYNTRYLENGDRDDDASGEWVFVYDVSQGMPRETQVVRVPETFAGIAFHPAGDRFWVSGGAQDSVRAYGRGADGRWSERGGPMPLGHLDRDGYGARGLRAAPYAAGLAPSASGERLVVANHDNDSVTILDAEHWIRREEIDLTPGHGESGGTFPFGVAVLGESRAFVTCQRDREVVEIDLDAHKVVRRIRVGGMPTQILANKDGTRLFVANANSDTVSVIDSDAGAVVSEIATSAPDRAWAPLAGLRGSISNGLALSPDEKTLYVTNGGNDTLAIVALGDLFAEDDPKAPRGGGRVSVVTGLVPTGLYPNAVSVSHDGNWLWVVHGKSTAGPNPEGPWSHPNVSRQRPYGVAPGNQFSLQLVKGGMVAIPVPRDPGIVSKLTIQALVNNRFADEAQAVPPIFAALRGKVKHVVFVVGENRTYDQLFGDLEGTDADPKMLHWGDAVTPNHHAVARAFVKLDRFFDSGGVSGDGWQWTMGGRATDYAEKEVPLEYAGRGKHSYDWEGSNRNLNMGLATLADRVAFNPLTPRDPNLLPGRADVGAVDGPDEGGRGFLWDVALAAGLTVRNYGAYCDEVRYGIKDNDQRGQVAKVPGLTMPSESKTRVAFPTKAALQAVTDPYFRGFDMKFADFWREKEWEREFDEHVAKKELPALEIVRLPHDHLGAFGRAADGVDTPDAQMADNDYAFGRLVDRLSRSPFWEETVVIKIEDDAQNGADHVDAHRSFALFAGGHVKRGGAVISSVYTTVSVLKTIELLLGLPPLGQHDAVARAMEEVFTTDVDTTPYDAIVPAVLRSTRLPLPPAREGEHAARPRGDAASWELATHGMDFDRVDALPVERWNRVLFCGLVDDRGCTSEAEDAMAERTPDDEDP